MDANVGKLTATQRTLTGKRVTRKMRQQGMIPAVVYGGAKSSQALTISPTDLGAALDPTKKQNTLIELTVKDDAGATVTREPVMLKEHQIDALKQTILHADFIRIALDQSIRVDIPVELEGRPVGVQLGGRLNQVFRTVPVACAPDQIPGKLTADVSELNIGDGIVTSDLALPDNVSICLPADQTIALVVAPRQATEAADEAEAGEEGAEEGAGGEGASGAAAGEAKSS